MSLLKITSSESFLTSRNELYYFVTGSFIDNDFNVNLTSINFFVKDKINFKVGETIDFNTLGIQLSEYSLFGSDHSNASLWYGKNNDMTTPINNVFEHYLNFIKNEKDYFDEDEYNVLENYYFLQFKFDDDTTLLLHNNSYYHDVCDINQISGNDIITCSAGADFDDINLSEMVLYLTNEFLSKKYKVLDDYENDDVAEEYEYGSEHTLKINNKDIKSKDIDALVSLYYNLISLVDDNEHYDLVKKRYEKYLIIKNIMVEDSEQHQHLVFMSENSNKEYKIFLKNENNDWIVEVEYGGVNKKMKTEVKIKTTNLQEAKECYTLILKEKLCKGYDFIKNNNLKLKGLKK